MARAKSSKKSPLTKNPSARPANAPLFYLDASSTLSLQDQIRQKIVSAVSSGTLPPGAKLPSSRELARQLGVARNTAILAYEQLVAEGFLASKPRSGIFVSETHAGGGSSFQRIAGRGSREATGPWEERFRHRQATARDFRAPPDWQQYRYPFLDGQFDSSLFPVSEWREANRLALSVADVQQWSAESGDADDDMLINEIRTKILPRRGIEAQHNEILITIGAQHALHLTSELFVDSASHVSIEEPGHHELRDLIGLRRASIHHQPVDGSGMIIDGRLAESDLVYVTPSHQRPTAVTMPIERREALLTMAEDQGFLIVEDDFERETSYQDRPLPALKSLDRSERVIYVANLSKVLAPAIRLGFMVAAPEVIREARKLRNLATRQPALSAQRAAAYFLSLGHYDATMWRLSQIFQSRVTALRDALNHYRPESIAIAPIEGGTSYWVEGPRDLDAAELARAAQQRGVLIEPAAHYYAAADYPKNVFRMGVTSIPAERIRDGVAVLSDVIRDLSGGGTETVPVATDCVEGRALTEALSGVRLLYETVYGDPCAIDLYADGTMAGAAGYANEDRDTGRWWVEGGLWCRQWTHWAYGEVAKFRTRIENGQVQWFNEAGRLVDRAVIAEAPNGYLDPI